MKILGKNLKKGLVKIIPETFDDLWHLYNIVYENDKVYARTTREIKPAEEYARPRRGQRIPVLLGVKAEKITWDRLLGRLRFHGTICEGPETVPIGAHHTINIALNRPLTVEKKKWAKHHIERLEKASKKSEKPITIVAIDDEGCVIAITKQYGIEVEAEDRIKLPGKLEAEKRSTAVKKYFQKALSSLRRVWTATHGSIVIIGVGFIKNDFAKYVKDEEKDIAESVVDVKSVNNNGITGIYEALRSGVLLKTMKHLRIMEETGVMNEVLKRLGRNEHNVVYGFDEVKSAAESGAVETMILADTVLRKTSDEKRLLLEDLMKGVEHKGGKVMIISTEHEAGAKLISLSGIVALLRFALS